MQIHKKTVLIIVPTFSPNTGGVETHMDDLVRELDRLEWRVFVQSYSPITTQGVKWKPKENFGNVSIRRYLWFGKTLLHRIEKLPFLDFLYITPYLFLRVFIFCIFHHKEIDVIHAQGLNAAFIGKYLKIIFKKKLIVSTHAVYEVNPQTRTAYFIHSILSSADKVLTLSKASYKELVSFHINRENLFIYRYWVDLNSFKPLPNKKDLKMSFNIPDRFSVLFVGRLTELKGIKELVCSAERLPFINFIFIGNGPLDDDLRHNQKRTKNILFLGRKDNRELPFYYNIADIFCIPSQYEEGFGRVVIEAVACCLPVVGSNKGGLPEALDNTVSILKDPTVDNLCSAITELYNNKKFYQRLKNNCRAYAEKYFGNKNAEQIIKYYGVKQ
ncbi:MAG: hypothetical protein DRP78_03035 [Candidatus Omnitrophota bacterium]|nr:MAG: hypothetical protein DRP78_03035 [Candidatus Omnitrophota bacterium]